MWQRLGLTFRSSETGGYCYPQEEEEEIEGNCSKRAGDWSRDNKGGLRDSNWNPDWSNFIRSLKLDHTIPIPVCGAVLNHRDSHHIGAPWSVLRDPGNVVLGGKLGNIVVGVQELNQDICCGAELLWGVYFNGQELGKEGRRVEVSLISKSLLPPQDCCQHCCLLFSYAKQLFLSYAH